MPSDESAEGVERKQCPYRGCDWEGRPYDPETAASEIAAEVDAEIHWEREHGGQIPQSAAFGEYQCPRCDSIYGFNGTVSCSDCGFIPKEVRA